MMKHFRYLILILLTVSSAKAQDVVDTLVSWPLNSAVSTSYDFFIYDTAKVDTSIYFKASGLINNSIVTSNGGQWGGIPTGYIDVLDYFEVQFTAKSGFEPKNLEITDIELDVANLSSIRRVTNIYLAYSFNADFSDSTIVYNYPDANIYAALVGSPMSLDYTFDSPIELASGQTIYFRVYPYLASNGLASFSVIKNSFIINGISRDESTVSKVQNFSFERTCVSEGRLNWSLPSGFNTATDTILIFAKRISSIDQGTPDADPNLFYGTPITDLDSLDGSIPSDVQYENDPDAMLVYRGVGTSIDLTNFENNISYKFAAFVVAGGGTQVYSNAALKNGSSANALADVESAKVVSKPNKMTLSWILPECYDSVMVVVKESTDPVSGSPSGTLTDYAGGVNADYTLSSSNFNGVDASEGKVVYVGTGTNVTVTGLTNAQEYNVTIWVEQDSIWSPGVYLSAYPDEYEGIITQTRSEGIDFIEFLTFKEIDFVADDIRAANYPACITGRMYFGGGSATAAGAFDVLTTVPAGTFVRVYNNGTANSDSKDGLVSISSGLFLLKSVGGDQVMIYKGGGQGSSFNLDCGPGTTVNTFISGFNYGNAGWLSPSSGIIVDANTSYAPPSVSNLEMPATSTPNFTFKDVVSVTGNEETIHNSISNVNTNWATGTGSSPSVKLKNIKFNESSISGGGFISVSGSDVKVTLKDIVTVTDSVQVRYMVVACAGVPPDNAVDRYTCYTPNLDYTLADSVVTAVSGQFTGSGTPCGTSRTKGNGRVMYISKDTTAFTLTNLPCGARMYVSLYVLKGNGITANLSSPITESILLPTSNSIYYSTGFGVYNDPGIWNSQADGLGTDFSGEFTDCISLVIQNNNQIAFSDDILLGSLTINAGRAVLENINMSLTKNLVANDSLITTDSRIIMDGLRQKNTISGTGYIELYELEVNNTNSTVGQKKLEVQTNVTITEGIYITEGNLEVTSGDTITLLATPTTAAQVNQSAFLGEIPFGSTVTGVFKIERYLPTINTNAPGGSGQGVGWRYISSTVNGATYEQMMDDFTCTGFTNSQYPNYGISNTGYYFPNLQKYDETVEGVQSFGFDGDYFSGTTNIPTTPPNIRNRRDKTEVIGQGEGIFAYIGPVAQTFDFIGTPNTGDIDVTLTYTNNLNSTEDGWNLVANPYPCPVRMADVSTSGGNIDGTIYIYDAETGIFSPFNRFGPVTILAAGQAFWAKVTLESSPKFEFEEADKVENSNVRFYKSDEQFENSLIVNMEMVSNPLYADLTTIWFNNDASNGFEAEYDGYKLYSLLDDVSGISTTIDGFDADVSINAIPELTSEITIPIKINIREVGNYTLSFEQFGDYIVSSCLTLQDLVLDTAISVDMMSTYTFYSDLRAEDAPARFLLTMTPPVSVSVTDATCFNTENGSAVTNGFGTGPFTYTWYNADMEMISTETVNGAGSLTDLGQGFYTVVIEGDNSECASQQKEFYISQPAELENSFTTNDPSCNQNDGYINLTLDPITTWDIAWMNSTTGQNGQTSDLSEYYTIGGLGYGDWEVIATSECGPQTYSVVLEDLNPVIADFEIPTEQVYIQDGEAFVEFTNTSENANEFSWFYADDQEVEDNSVNGSYTFTEAGVYGISLLSMNENGCYDEITYELVVLDATGVTELPGGVIRSYIAYGNGNPQYVIELDQAKQVQVQMVNSIGQVISTQRVNVSGKTLVDLPTYDLSSGIYLIITLDDGTRIDTKKLFVR